MPDADDILDSLAENATGPKRVQVGNQSVEQHSLAEQAEAARQIANREATTRPGFGWRAQRIKPVYY